LLRLYDLVENPVAFVMGLLYSMPAIILALMLHEVAHGYVAYLLGDPTAKVMGRLTLNPLKHLDPVGTFMMVFVGIGWARPVPVNPRNFKHYRRDDLLVSIAGVTVNFLLFVLSTVIMALLMYSGYVDHSVWYMRFILTFMSVNAALCAFNLLPIPPLDGYHVVNDLFLKRELFAPQMASQVGMVVLIGLSVTGYLGRFLSFVVNGMYNGVWRATVSVFELFGII